MRYLTLTDGTGVVHIAPAFGEDDSKVGRAYDLPFLQLVDEKGEMTAETPWAGTFCKKADKEVLIDLEKRGLMTDFGREKIQEARKNGQWDKPSGPPAVTAEQIGTVAGLLKEHEPAYTNFQKMPPSVQKTYTRAYYDARTDAGRARRFAWMVERLEKNLKPM